ncbi:B-cell receptor CD22-like [Hoplias malabaricus]|uniref:B-cell receptor CD22-like n=1 Tax=Hoplias malabaricus TaxID=27720 RepID=UPI003462574A
MSLRLSPSLPLTFLLMIVDGLTVTKTFWIIDPVHGVEKPDLSKESDYSGRVEYFTDKQKHFSLKLSNVEKKDEHHYYFRIITDEYKWLGYPGVQLIFTELSVETPGAVTEGGAAVLKCVTTCSLTAPTFIWYKNGHPLTTKTTINNQLHLQPVSSEDADSYSCAVNGYQHLPSPNNTLTVRYPPKNVSVSISPPGEIVEDSSVTLTCSSDANPPVEVYTWFIEGEVSPVGSGHSYSPLQSGSYYCEARNEHGSQRSAPFFVRGNSVIVFGAVAVGVGIGVLLFLIVWMIRIKKQNRNMNALYVNVDYKTRPPEDDVTSLPDYENIQDMKIHPDDDDDACSIPEYGNAAM